MAKVLANGVILNYNQAGDGPNIVLVHGLGANSAFWYFNTMPALRKEFRVTAYDLRGHGYSEMPRSGYTSADMAHDLGDLLNHLDIDHAHLVGHSFGGAIALHCAALMPERVRSVVVADGRIRALQPRQKVADWPFWKRWRSGLGELGLDLLGNEELDFTLLEKHAHETLRKPGRAVHDSTSFLPFTGLSGGSKSAEMWLRLLNTTNAKEELRSVEGLTIETLRGIYHPTLAIYGEYSFCLPSCNGLQKWLRSCEVRIVSGVGHFHPVIKPACFTDVIRTFIHRQDTRAKHDGAPARERMPNL